MRVTNGDTGLDPGIGNKTVCSAAAYGAVWSGMARTRKTPILSVMFSKLGLAKNSTWHRSTMNSSDPQRARQRGEGMDLRPGVPDNVAPAERDGHSLGDQVHVSGAIG